jgi:helicase
MRIFELSRYNIPEKIIDAWIKERGDDLLPVQERAIKLYRVLDGTSLLISSPVTSGKTFIGEIASVKGALERKKIVYLVPLKSIAEEMHIDFLRKYESFGIRTVVSSRDRREYDRMIEAGEFGIALIVYEKMAQLMVKNPFLLKRIEMVIIDDLHEIGNPDRGPGLEVTLTKIITLPYRPQIIGLSAVLSNADTLARWLEADLFSHDRLPVELCEGAIYKAVFQYRTRNTLKKEIEAPASMALDDSADILLANIVHLIERGDQILIILPSGIDTMVFARILADRVKLARASGAIKDLTLLQETSLKKGLIYCLQRSIAFLHTDLSRDERKIIKKYAQKGEIRVIFCTNTLAMDVNLPAKTLLLHTRKWESDGCNHMALTPIEWAEYEKINGSAGKHEYGQDYGKPIIFACNECDLQMLRENYVGEEGVRMLASRLGGSGLENHLLNIMASGLARNRVGLEAFLCRTFMGLSESRETTRKGLEEAIRFLFDNGFIEQDYRDEMRVTYLGNVVASEGITCLTALDLALFLREEGNRELAESEVLHAAASSDDGKKVYFRIAVHEHRSRKYEHFAKEIFEGQREYIDTFPSSVIKTPLLLTKDKAKTRKHNLLLDRWIRGENTPSLKKGIESCYGKVAEGMSWIVGAASLIAQSIDSPEHMQKRLSVLSERLLYGVEEKGLELARLRVRGLNRTGIRKLVKKGLDSRHAIQETPVMTLAKMIPKNVAIDLKKAVEVRDEEPIETKVIEAISPDNTFICCDRIEITGKPIEKRNLVMINGSRAGITNRSLELLLRFAVTLKKDGRGWVHSEDISSGIGLTQLISRLRSELRSLTLTKDGKIIENDGSGNYRLSIPPQNVVVDIESLLSHWNAVIRDLAELVQGRS